MVDVGGKPTKTPVKMNQDQALPRLLTEALKTFKVQPIVSATSYDMVALELLAMERPSLTDLQKVLANDVAALWAARCLSDYIGPSTRVHVNVELTSLLNSSWFKTMAVTVKPGIVVELVERNDVASTPRGFMKLRGICEIVQSLGGQIALDGSTGTDSEVELIEMLRPTILKVNTQCGLEGLTSVRSPLIVVAERIESQEQAYKATQLGASELQGYWCDEMHEFNLPHQMTLPGVMARDVRLAFSD